ncbi:hypothetical protein [Escherichia coli]|uniref:hypothetical protein n=1 Tax=Escherichia coli TaxID=562 RepID=UPI000DA4D1A9|nr:hypothetical protein [Escherichia coli]MBO0260152.1 hypothetical protein [Escherichia coli]SQL83492.1 Uncharacterised protein [Escherichia coli]SQM12228.1 Uncharacterised protein [Escherichia coli]SQM26866.1 Uncharacterised protein [Escherichia coli]SQS27316.1 Uncharacterised protein [Escherichia coli]
MTTSGLAVEADYPETIRLYQHQLARIAVGAPVADKNSDLTAFLQGLAVAGQEGSVNPLHHPAPSKPRHRRTLSTPRFLTVICHFHAR